LSLDRDGALPLGILDEQNYGEATVSLQSGDLLLLYTDGITEAVAPLKGGDAPRELFGVERLDPLLIDCGGSRAEECIARIRGELADFSQAAPPSDDQTLIAMRCV